MQKIVLTTVSQVVQEIFNGTSWIDIDLRNDCQVDNAWIMYLEVAKQFAEDQKRDNDVIELQKAILDCRRMFQQKKALSPPAVKSVASLKDKPEANWSEQLCCTPDEISEFLDLESLSFPTTVARAEQESGAMVITIE